MMKFTSNIQLPHEYMTRIKSVKKWLCLATALLLAACSGNSPLPSDLQQYQERVSSFTNIPPSSHIADINIDLNPPQKLPLAVNIEEISINLREFYAFNDCSINSLIAQRNTAMGKMQLPSARLAYEASLLDEFTRCSHLLEQNTEKQAILEKLLAWQAIKVAQMPLVWSNFFTQSDETFMHFTSANDVISGDETDNFVVTKQALQHLAAIDTSKQIDISELESHLQALEHSRLLAKMWRTQQFITKALNVVSVTLEQYLKQNTCSNQKQADDITIMRNIFTLFFAELIQPIGGELNKYHYQLSPLVDTILKKHPLPDEFSIFVRAQIGQEHQKYKDAMQRHIHLWQQIFARCE